MVHVLLDVRASMHACSLQQCSGARRGCCDVGAAAVMSPSVFAAPKRSCCTCGVPSISPSLAPDTFNLTPGQAQQRGHCTMPCMHEDGIAGKVICIVSYAILHCFTCENDVTPRPVRVLGRRQGLVCQRGAVLTFRVASNQGHSIMRHSLQTQSGGQVSIITPDYTKQREGGAGGQVPS